MGRGANGKRGREPSVDGAHELIVKLRQGTIDHDPSALDQRMLLNIRHNADYAPFVLAAHAYGFANG